MKLLFFLIAFPFLAVAQSGKMFPSTIKSATDKLTLYVSEAGAGSGTGTSAGNAMSLANFLALAPSTIDTIYFNRGDEFEMGDINFSSRKVLSTFGSGDDPAFLGSIDISGETWTSAGGDLYYALISEPNWVIINGKCAINAETDRLPVLTRPTDTTATITHSLVSGYSDIVNSYIVIKVRYWTQSLRRTVTNYNGAGLITFDGFADVNGATNNNIDLVLYNKKEFLDGNDQWAWESDTLWVQAAASPSTMNIRAINTEYGIKSTAEVVVDNIEFKEYYTAAIWSDGGNVIITDSYFHDIRDTPVLIEKKVTAPSITNSTFERFGNNGIFMRPCDDATITGNTIDSAGMLLNYGWQTWTETGAFSGYSNSVACGINYVIDFEDDTIDGENLTCQNNTITNSAYCGVHMGCGTDNNISYNKVTGYTKRFKDGGGIYTYHYLPYAVPNANNIISYNNVDGEGSFAGLTNVADIGIYCDNGSYAANVNHNTIKNSEWGILLNQGTSNHTVEYNNVLNCDYSLVIRQWNLSNRMFLNNVNNNINYNVFAATDQADKCIFFNLNYGNPTWNPYSGTGGADNNVYSSIYTFNIAHSDNKGGDLSLGTLRTAYGEDAASSSIRYIGQLTENYTSSTSAEDADSYSRDSVNTTVTTYGIGPYYSRLIYEKPYSDFFVASSSQDYDGGTYSDMQFTNTSTFAISFWFKAPSNPAATQFFISNFNASGRGYGVGLRSDGTIIFNMTSTTGTNRALFVTSVDIADNAWHHILCYKASSVGSSKIYVDGVDAGSVLDNTLSTTLASTDPITIGSYRTSSNYYDGYIDEVAIWNTNVTGGVSNIYNSGRGGDLRVLYPTNVLHYWRLGLPNDLLDVGVTANALDLTGSGSPPTSSTDAANN